MPEGRAVVEGSCGEAMREHWQEEWDDKLKSDVVINRVDNGEREPVAHFYLGADDIGIRRARLAAAAPDMARALLAVEWVKEIRQGSEVHACPSCGGLTEEAKSTGYYQRVSDFIGKPLPIGHVEGCALDAALRKAGVR